MHCKLEHTSVVHETQKHARAHTQLLHQLENFSYLTSCLLANHSYMLPYASDAFVSCQRDVFHTGTVTPLVLLLDRRGIGGVQRQDEQHAEKVDDDGHSKEPQLLL